MNILLGISGGIAAYKTPELVRRLIERGADVQVVMTASAGKFVTETSLQAVSGRPVRNNLWDKEAEASMSHIDLARWADMILIAPATAEIMARLASGAASDLLTTLCLASESPIVIAPAMNRVMWNNPAVQANRETLETRGVFVIGPDSGSQACGETGAGRMSEPDDIAGIIFSRAQQALRGDGLLHGKTVMVTAGPTREAIDPVRYITNLSSGKMGYAMAAAAAAEGATVILVSGPVNLKAPGNVELVNVLTAEQLYAATHQRIADVDIFISTAAVADYRPVTVGTKKIKKDGSEMNLALTRTKDVLASVAQLAAAPFTVGFAAETNDVRENALLKLKNKKLDMIIANKVGPDCGFDRDDNRVDAYWPNGSKSLPTAAKTALAAELITLITQRFHGERGTEA